MSTLRRHARVSCARFSVSATHEKKDLHRARTGHARAAGLPPLLLPVADVDARDKARVHRRIVLQDRNASRVWLEPARGTGAREADGRIVEDALVDRRHATRRTAAADDP